MLTKSFFESLGELLNKYLDFYGCGLITLTLTALGKEYDVVQILQLNDEAIVFAYYSEDKSLELSEAVQEKTGELKAWPAISIPYRLIDAIEFNPAKPEKRKAIGFKTERW